jgi:hypothetical protein
MCCPVFGPRQLTASDLNGFSLLVPETAPDVKVEISGMRGTLDFRRAKDVVHAGFDAVYRDWQKLEWPDS